MSSDNVKLWGSIHIQEDGTIKVDIPQNETEETDKAKLVFDFIMFALNNSDCINIFNVADELNRKFVIQEKLINEVSRRIEQTGAVLDADEIWSFIDDFHKGKIKYSDEAKGTVIDYLIEKDKITFH